MAREKGMVQHVLETSGLPSELERVAVQEDYSSDYSIPEQTRPPVQIIPLPSKCPCCGNVSEKPKRGSIQFDYWKGLLKKGRKTVSLNPNEADIISILLESWPKPIDKKKVLKKVLGQKYYDIADDRLLAEVYASKLRKKITPIGLTIKTTPKRGWYLAEK